MLTKTQCTVSDAIELSSRRITPEGFLVAPATIARTGVQVYRAGELGLGKDSGMDAMRSIRLHRPAEEVFDPESVASFQNLPITLNHPAGNVVNASNWKQTAVGDMQNVAGAGTTLNGLATVRDHRAVGAVIAGKKFLSGGYSFEMDPTPGRAADGQEYDAVMRKIRGNHVAIVDSPRGGPVCRIADTTIQHGDETMRKFVVDGISVEMEDGAASDVFAKLMGDREAANLKLAAKVTVGDKEFSVANATAIQSAVDGLLKENAELKAGHVTPDQIAEQVSARVKLVGDAQKLIPDFAVDGKSDVQIQREVVSSFIAKDESAKTVVDAVLSGVTVDVAEPALLAIAFRTLSAASRSKPQTTAADAALSTALLGNDGKGGNGERNLTGRDAYIEATKNAWATKLQ